MVKVLINKDLDPSAANSTYTVTIYGIAMPDSFAY